MQDIRTPTPASSVQDHALFTRMLFADALVGLGIPDGANKAALVDEGLVSWSLVAGGGVAYSWDRGALEAMGVDDLQAMYLAIKYDVVVAEDVVAEGAL